MPPALVRARHAGTVTFMKSQVRKARRACLHPNARYWVLDEYGPETIAKLAKDHNSTVRLFAAAAKNADEATLASLSNSRDEQIQAAVAWNPSTTSTILENLYNRLRNRVEPWTLKNEGATYYAYDLAAGLAKHANTPGKVLEELYNFYAKAETEGQLIRGMATNPNSSTNLLETLASEHAYYMSIANHLCENPNITLNALLTVVGLSQDRYLATDRPWQLILEKATMQEGPAGTFAAHWAQEQRQAQLYYKHLEDLKADTQAGLIDDETLTLAIALVVRTGLSCTQALESTSDILVEEPPSRKTRTRNTTTPQHTEVKVRDM